ncbi:MAG: hypothetical protein IJT61_00450 [Bacteroidales bacterium]|nr:hypothetical protein [Bacteroidales bacterium]MBQ7734391.1 hypothetical protein [Bacteroidales bacterium]
MNNTNQQILQEKVRQFVKKYYLNKLYKGGIIFLLIVLGVFIAFSLFEYFSYSNTVVRSVLFYSFIGVGLLTLVFYILIPVAKLAGLGKQLTNEEIASIIGKHFHEIDDKLLNTFELQQQLERGEYKSYELLSAAIDSKIDSFKTYSFVQAVPVKKTRKIARWALIPLAIFLLLFSLKSELFTEPTKRIVHHTQVYEKPAPYNFSVMNEKLTAFQHDDFTVNVKVEGSEIPDEVYIRFNNRSFKCEKLSNTDFAYTFSNMQKNTDFQFVTEEVESVVYTVSVLPKPVTLGFVMELHYPAYLNKPDDVMDNVGNATVPEGTVINWVFYTKNSDNLIFIVQDKENVLTSENDNYAVKMVARNSFTYSIYNKNKYFTGKDTLTDEITVIKDMYPEIFVQSQRDSSYQDRIYFKGNIKDDYGFSGLRFVYTKYDADGKVLEANKSIPINIQSNVTIQDFYYYCDPNTFDLDPGEKIDYYFIVSDNDGVNGHKSSKTTPSTFKIKSLEEINEDIEKSEQQTKSGFNDLLEESAQLMKDIDKLQKQMLQEKDLSWQDKKKLEKLMEQYKELQDKINELQQKNENQNSLESQYKNIDQDIIKKQQELQKRMDQILSDEMKEMMQKLQNMMQQGNKDQIQKQMQKMKNNTEDINKTLDQQLQLYKQLEVEKKLNEAVKDLRDLSLELQQNAAKTNDKNQNKDKLKQEQLKIQDKYNQIKEDLKELQKLNQELEDPTKFKSTEELQKDADQQLQQGRQNLDRNNRQKSAENQQKAAEDMDKIANQMEQDFNESELENVSEDIETLRQILDNLVKISFSQEEVLEKTKRTKAQSAMVSDISTKQHQVKSNMKIIEDSLNALARRQMSVKPFIQTELSKIQDYIGSSVENIQERRMSNAASDQQFTLTSMNNLALMLNESMKEMQKKKSECKSKCNKSGNGSCSKPGGNGKSKKTSARELQQQLNRQMEAMKKSMDQQGKQGQSGQQKQWSEQFAKMAAQQEAIRKMLEDYNNAQKSRNGVGDKSLEQLINDMKKTENELVNRTLTQQTIQRQQSITTRLLQSERAEMEREKEEERKSNEARQTPRLNPPKDWKFDTEKTHQNEMLRSVPANLNYYYKEKANTYFYNID